MISNLINNPESKTLEFKRDLSSPRSVLRTLVAFANSAGGHLILGVADDRKIIGVENPLDEEERLSNLIADSISPRLVPSIEMITVEGKTLLVVEVFLRKHSEITVVFMGKSNSSIRHEIPRG
jgi:ATP-dependent DNA helicase RecG